MDKPALVSLTFDDGLRCQFERAVPILDQHGFQATFSWLLTLTQSTQTVTSTRTGERRIGVRRTSSLLKDLIQRGHEIGAHSVTHRRPELDNDPKLEAGVQAMD